MEEEAYDYGMRWKRSITSRQEDRYTKKVEIHEKINKRTRKQSSMIVSEIGMELCEWMTSNTLSVSPSFGFFRLRGHVAVPSPPPQPISSDVSTWGGPLFHMKGPLFHPDTMQGRPVLKKTTVMYIVSWECPKIKEKHEQPNG